MENHSRLHCTKHKKDCILLGSSGTCYEKALVCEEGTCMTLHSMKSHEHNFYNQRDFARMTGELHSDYSKMVAEFKDSIAGIIQRAISQLEIYQSKQFQLVEERAMQIFSKNVQQSQAIVKVLKKQQQSLTCREIYLLQQRHECPKKLFDYSEIEGIQQMIESISADIYNNQNVFKFGDIRYSIKEDERNSSQEVESYKKRSQISRQNVQNDNISLYMTIWEKMDLKAQRDVEQAVKQLKWDAEEWDLSEGAYEPLRKLLECSLMVHHKSLITLKLFHNELTTIQPLTKCHFSNLSYLYIASNHIQSLECILFMDFPQLKRFSAYDNDITSLRPLVKVSYPRLKYLFLTTNHLQEFSDFRMCTFQRLSQLSFSKFSIKKDNNQAVQLEVLAACDFANLYYLNMKNKNAVTNAEGKYFFEKRITNRYPFSIL